MYMEPWPGAWLQVPKLFSIFGTSVPCHCYSAILADTDSADECSADGDSTEEICMLSQLNISEFGCSDDEPDWL